MSDEGQVLSVEELRAAYRRPSHLVMAKQLGALDRHCRAFVAHSPLVMLATADEQGRCDVSPRGGPPGFVRVLDDHRLVLPDLAGNNRLDSFSNLVANAGVGLLFLIPGLEETLRVNGTASLTTDPETLAVAAVGGTRCRMAAVVTVEEAYIHCGKALRRAGAWEPATWPQIDDMASVPAMFRDQVDLGEMTVDDVADALESGYQATLWQPGGVRPAEPDREPEPAGDDAGG